MNGYYRREQDNVKRSMNGWHHTNDLGIRLPDGSISFVGPKTAMIKSGVENIYPAEVENCLRAHPAVADVCVIGVPDPTWTQSVKAVVVLKLQHATAPEELIEHCRSRIASYKKPRYVEFSASLPRLPGGPVDRKAVDAAFGGGGYPSC
jgi:long-chain acyl-CoA synthetase